MTRNSTFIVSIFVLLLFCNAHSQDVFREYNNYYQNELSTFTGNSENELMHKREAIKDWNALLQEDIDLLSKKINNSNDYPPERITFFESDRTALLYILNDNLALLNGSKAIINAPSTEETALEETKEIEEVSEVTETKNELPDIDTAAVELKEEKDVPNDIALEIDYFRVQVAALKEKKSIQEVQAIVNTEEPLEIIEEDGYFKYQFGRFANRTEADEAIENLRNKNKDCFVVFIRK